MYLALTCLAALSFSIGGYFMKESAGLTHLKPALLVFVLFGIGAALQTLAMRGHPMAVTYIVVLGLEAITALCLGIFVLHEGTSILKLGGVAFVLVGIVMLKASA